MFKLHIYNPEHDIALGKNIAFFTPPKAAKLTKKRFCHIPALWAEDGDWVLVDVEPTQALPKGENQHRYAKVRFVTWDDLRKLKKEELPSRIEPWGWDKLLVGQLLRCNPLFASLVPTADELETIRQLSSRQFVAENILPELVATDENFMGEMEIFSGTIEEIELLLAERNTIVAKSPWSCSGRGVRFLHDGLTDNEKGWIVNTIKEQGCLMLEPLYNKIMDFAMEFHAMESRVKYQSLNIFETKDGKYVGNIEGSQEDKLRMLTRYIPQELIASLRESIIDVTAKAFRNRYSGPFGIDAMIILTPENQLKVHPCVEMNLRRTMGQVSYK